MMYKSWIGKKVRVVLIAGLLLLTLVMATEGTPMQQHVSAKHGGSGGDNQTGSGLNPEPGGNVTPGGKGHHHTSSSSSISTGPSHGGLTQIASNKTELSYMKPSLNLYSEPAGHKFTFMMCEEG